MNLLIFDNQDITREGLKSIAGRSKIYSSIQEVNNVKHFITYLQEHPRSAVILDYTLIELSADELLVIKQRFPESKFILFSDNLSPDFIRRMLFSNEFFSIVMKDSSLQEIEEGINSSKDNRRYVCNKVNSWLNKKESVTRMDISPLTTTEKEILKSMSLGKSTKEIASERFLSVYTVMTHRKNIFRKLGVNNASEAQAWTSIGHYQCDGILYLKTSK